MWLGYVALCPSYKKVLRYVHTGGRLNHFGSTCRNSFDARKLLRGNTFLITFWSRKGQNGRIYFGQKIGFFDPSTASFWRSNGFRSKTLLLLRKRAPPEFLSPRAFRGERERFSCPPVMLRFSFFKTDHYGGHMDPKIFPKKDKRRFRLPFF